MVAIQLNCCVYSLRETLRVYACYDETGLVECLGTLGARAYADGREGVANAEEEAALFG